MKESDTDIAQKYKKFKIYSVIVVIIIFFLFLFFLISNEGSLVKITAIIGFIFGIFFEIKKSKYEKALGEKKI